MPSTTRASGGTRFYDSEPGSSVTKGPGTHEDRSDWERRPAKPQETPWLEWRDWGARTLPQFQVWWEPDPGLMLAAGLRRQTWGFRKFPYASLQSVQLQFSTGRQDFKFNYDGEFRRENSKLYFVVDAQASGLENLNYFGAGNGTSSEPPEGETESFFDAASDTVHGHRRAALGSDPDRSRPISARRPSGPRLRRTRTPSSASTSPMAPETSDRPA